VDLQDLTSVTLAALLSSAAAGHFTRITSLMLSRGALNSDELSALLVGMPQLNRLALCYWKKLASLRFLSTPQLAASLTELDVIGCQALSLLELEHPCVVWSDSAR